MDPKIRKTVVYVENLLIEGGKPSARPYKAVAAAAVLANPWAGKGYVENLKPAIMAVAPAIGEALVPLLIDAVGTADIEAYGKAAVAGTAGEIEHASALIHTLYFGNQLRERVSGTSFLPFSNKRGGPGCTIDLPMKHKTAEGTRSHFLTITFAIHDAPAPDEVVVALGVAISGRPHARIGDRYQDMKEMGVDQTVDPRKGPKAG